MLQGGMPIAAGHELGPTSGTPQGHEDSQGKLADLRAAVAVLMSRAEVDPDRVGLVGVCLGGGYAVRAAAADPRVKAVVGIAGAYNSPAWFARQMGLATYRSALRSLLDRYDEYLLAVAPAGGEAAMAGDEPYAYYGTARSASPHWENRVPRGSLHALGLRRARRGGAARRHAASRRAWHGRRLLRAGTRRAAAR
jgi:dienelactone hydrolase